MKEVCYCSGINITFRGVGCTMENLLTLNMLPRANLIEDLNMFRHSLAVREAAFCSNCGTDWKPMSPALIH